MSRARRLNRIPPRINALCRRFIRDRAGAIAVEGAFAITFVVALLVPLIDVGQYIGTKIELEQALRAGGGRNGGRCHIACPTITLLSFESRLCA